MTVANPVQSDVILPPGPANGNGAGTVHPDVVQAAVQAADAEAERKLAAIAQLGRAITFKERELGKQETAVAEAESALKKEREARNKIEREVNEMKDELVNLSTGKPSERLFKDPALMETATAAPADPNKTAEQALQDAFDAMPLAEIGVKSALADKLVADGIRYGKELREWVQNHVRRDIKGVGPKAIENLGELMAVKMLAMKAAAEEAAMPAVEPFDDAEIKADGRELLVNVAELVEIEVGQRNGGRWAHKCSWQYGESATALTWKGDFPTRDEAAVAAADLIDEALPKKGLKGKAAKEAAAIRRELDRMEKALAEEAKADLPEKVKKQLARGAAKYGELQTA